MTDPHRLSSNLSDADDLERDLLASIRQVDPPAGAKSEAWDKLSVQIAAVGLVSVASVQGTTAASPAWLSGAFKGTLGKVLLGVAVAGTGSALWLHARDEQPAAHVAATAVAVAVSPPPAPTAPLAPTSEIAPVVPPAAATPVEIPTKLSGEASREDRLSAESQMLTRARAELRRGNAASAQRILEQMRVKFPNAVLGQEREVLNIEVLAARGNSDAARRRARAFIAAYPKSPHSAQLARFADGP
jgi:hypothetical protein